MEVRQFCCNLCHSQIIQVLDPITKTYRTNGAAIGLAPFFQSTHQFGIAAGSDFHKAGNAHLCDPCTRALAQLAESGDLQRHVAWIDAERAKKEQL